MNYEPNTIQWPRGSIVIHDADAKEPKMLMRIIGYTRSGLAKCQYIDKRKKRTIYPNPIAVLHDPTQFKFYPRTWYGDQSHIELCQHEFEQVCIWNSRYKVGQRVRTTSADGGFEAVTTTEAEFFADYGRVRLGTHGYWALKFVEAIT